MRDVFEKAVRTVQASLTTGEAFRASFFGENSTFVRFNRSRIRQPGSVVQAHLVLDLIEGRRHTCGSVALSGEREIDAERLERLAGDLRGQREHVPEDPWLLFPESVVSTCEIREGRLPDGGEAADAVLEAGRDRDLVGLLASGEIHVGFADSRGQRNWHGVPSFHVDWSFCLPDGRAVKANYAGTHWDAKALAARAARAASELDALARPPISIERGEHRVALAPDAIAEILGILSWGGFGLRAHRTKTTPLLKMIENGARLHPSITLLENARGGIAPSFGENGFARPDTVVLIESGSFRECLVSPRSAAEYGVPCNGASVGEAPESIEMSAGDLEPAAIVRLVGDGVYVGNVHYLNFSDRTAGRITGLTRFGTFRVIGGEIAGPLEVMRFDDSIYRVLGENLVGATDEHERIFSDNTYVRRSTASTLAPAVLTSLRLV